MLNPAHSVGLGWSGYNMGNPQLAIWGWEILGFWDAVYFQWLYLRQLSDMGLANHFLSSLTQAWVENPQKMDCRYTGYTHYTMIMEMSSCQVARTKEPVEPLSVSWSKDNEPLSHWATCRTWRLKSCCSPRSWGGLKRSDVTRRVFFVRRFDQFDPRIGIPSGNLT